MKLVWANTNYRAFKGSAEGIIRSPWNARRTILLMHSSYFESVLTIQYAIIVKLVPQGRSCEPWAGKLGEGVEIQAIDDANKTISSYKTCGHRGCSVEVWQREVESHNRTEILSRG